MARSAIKSFVMNRGRSALDGIGGWMASRSSHGDKEVFERDAFDWVAELEAGTSKIQAELKEVLKEREAIPPFQEVSKDQAHLTNDERWRTYFLYAYGFRSDDNCQRCPETAKLLESIPGLSTAFFSILQGPKEIPPHRGPYRGVLRFHLGLVVPTEDVEQCGIRVGSQRFGWQSGRGVVFDDTYEHEAWNRTSEERVVLFVDFRRPLPPMLDRMNRSFLWAVSRSPLVQDGLKNFEEWTKKVEQKKSKFA